jgi:hypothetical protein
MSTSEQSHMRTGSQSPRAMERITIALDGAWQFGVVEAIWALIAFRRW